MSVHAVKVYWKDDVAPSYVEFTDRAQAERYRDIMAGHPEARYTTFVSTPAHPQDTPQEEA